MDNNSINQPQINNQTPSSQDINPQPVAQVKPTKNKKAILVFVVAVLWIASLAGVYLFASKEEKNNTMSNNDNSGTTNENSSVKDTDSSAVNSIYDSSKGLPYIPANRQYSVALPAGWKLTVPQDEDDLIAWNAADIIFKADGNSIVSLVDPNNKMLGGSSAAFYLIYDYTKNEKSYLSDKLVKEKTYKTANGIDVTKYMRTQTNEADTNGGMDIPVGTIQYTYDLVSGSKNIHIVHDILKGEKDQSAIIETMIESVKFL